LPVPMVIVASGGHASLVDWGALGKRSLCLLGRRRAAAPCEHAQLQSDFLADEVSFLRKKVLFGDFEHLGKEFDLFVGSGTPQRFDIGEDFARHVDIANQLEFGDEFGL
jgi:hypothetical protein